MNAAPVNTKQLTHKLAAEIHRVMAAKRLDVDALAAQLIESPAFLRRVLVGEDGLGKVINLDFVQAISNATGRTMYLKISPQRSVKRKPSVKSGDA